MSDRLNTTAKKRQNSDSIFNVNSFESRGFGLQAKSAESVPASKAELWESYQQAKQLNQKGANTSDTLIQTKLTVGQPGDKYEQEADSVADRVMAMSEPAQVQREGLPEEEEELQMKPLAGTISPLVQREELPEEEEELQMKPLDNLIQREELPEEEEELQMKEASTPSSQLPTDSLEDRLSSSKGGGSPLSDDVRSFMEPRFGSDFSGVRVHTGSDAVQMNQDVNAQAFAHGSDVYFGAGKAPGKDALTAHELTHVVQQTGSQVARKSIQQAATTLVQRDKTADKLKELNIRTSVLEKKSSAIQLDLQYRALFGAKVSNYKQVVYRLTGGFQSAGNSYQATQSKQAASDAVKDQLLATILLVAGTTLVEPFLSVGLGRLKPTLDRASQKIQKIEVKDIVEKLENPINAAASGAGNTITTIRAGDRTTTSQAPGVPADEGAGKGGGDPLTLLTSNMETLEGHTQKIEAAFSSRAEAYETMNPDQWNQWSKDTQAAKYKEILDNLDTVALASITNIKEPDQLSTTIELVLWAAWIRTFFPGFNPLNIKAHQAKRLKDLGVESLAGVTLDTTWILWNSHKSSIKGKEFDTAMYEWARKLPSPLTK